jgi:hypothetical protein
MTWLGTSTPMKITMAVGAFTDLILHHTFERAAFPSLAPGVQPRKCRIAIVPDLLWQTDSMGNKILCGSRLQQPAELRHGPLSWSCTGSDARTVVHDTSWKRAPSARHNWIRGPRCK